MPLGAQHSEEKKIIVVRLLTRHKRNAALSKFKKRKTRHYLAWSPSSSSPVDVNEHLMRQTKQSFGAAIARRREMAWLFVWSSGGKIFARKDKNADALGIVNWTPLEKLSV